MSAARPEFCFYQDSVRSMDDTGELGLCLSPPERPVRQTLGEDALVIDSRSVNSTGLLDRTRADCVHSWEV